MSSSIQYICLAYKTTPLVNRGKTNALEKQYYQDIVPILKGVADKDNYVGSQSSGDVNLYVLIMKKITMVAFAGSTVTKQQVMGLGQELIEDFLTKYQMTAIQRAAPLQMDTEFGPILRDKVENVKLYKMAQVKADLTETKQLIVQNLDAVVKRTQKLEEIDKDAQSLRENAGDFLDQTDKLKKDMNKKRWCIIGCICGGAAAVIVCIVVPIVVKK